MKNYSLTILVLLCIGLGSQALSQAVMPTSQTVMAETGPLPDAALASPTPEPSGSMLEPATPADAPPEWLGNVLKTISDMPLVGPYVVKILEWLGVLATFMTSFVTFLLIVSKSLGKVAKIAKLETLTAFLEKFEKSKALYWLKYFSLYNAKKDQTKTA